ncbi:MAG: hypothetical protein KAW87_03165 [Candidatus Cloacimonetes bacterium]|nr:hypothetical protein [Candidatus Cloacimonadota bacterium]
MSKKILVMSRLTSLRNYDKRFDLEFWSKLGVEKKFIATWEMTREVNLIRGKNGTQSRFQRSFSLIRKRES